MNAGLSAGQISGLALNVSALGGNSKDQLIKIEVANNSATEITDVNLQRLNFIEVYHYVEPIDQTGWVDFQFLNPYNWNGNSSLIIAISKYSKEEESGFEVATDSYADGTLVGSESNYALDFKKGGQYVNLGRDAQISGNEPRTIEMWAYTEEFNGGGIFQAGPTGATGRDFSLRTMGSDNRWRVQLWGAGDFDVTLPGSKGAWHHYAVVYDGNSCRLYYDGQLIQSTTVALNTGEHDIWIGRWGGSYFNGKIDDVRVWNTALTSSVIQSWMSRKITNNHPAYNDLKGYYRFNEGTGTSVKDESPNANADGNFVRLPWWSSLDGDQRINELETSGERPTLDCTTINV